jgi:hypothetical protein
VAMTTANVVRVDRSPFGLVKTVSNELVELVTNGVVGTTTAGVLFGVSTGVFGVVTAGGLLGVAFGDFGVSAGAIDVLAGVGEFAGATCGDVVTVLLDCRLASAYTLDASNLSCRSRTAMASWFDVNTPSLKCGCIA